MIAFAETSVPYAPTLAPIVRDWALSWEPKPRISTEQWAEENVHLPEQITPMPGPFLIKRSPYVRGPFRAFDDPVTKQMTLVWGTQLAKTLVLQILLAKVAATIPAPCLLATPDLSSNRKLRDKFKLICQESPNIWEIAGVHEWNDKVLAFARNLVFLGYAGSTQTL
ncbi:MAG TPA: phage terminase large subunit family protein, partial [Pirellulales bacterium]